MNLTPNQNQLVVGGLALPVGGLKILRSISNAGGARASFVDVSLGGTTRATSYVVPGGKTFVLYAIKIFNAYGAAATQYIFFDYADNDVGSNGSATAMTNPKGMFTGNAGDTNYADSIGFLCNGASNPTTSLEVAQGGSVPTGKYPAISIGALSGASTIWLYGYEV